MWTNSKEALELLEKIKNSKEPRKLNKMGEWFKTHDDPLFDTSELTPKERKSFMRAVMK